MQTSMLGQTILMGTIATLVVLISSGTRPTHIHNRKRIRAVEEQLKKDGYAGLQVEDLDSSEIKIAQCVDTNLAGSSFELVNDFHADEKLEKLKQLRARPKFMIWIHCPWEAVKPLACFKCMHDKAATGNVACDFYRTYKADVMLMKSMGLWHYGIRKTMTI